MTTNTDGAMPELPVVAYIPPEREGEYHGSDNINAYRSQKAGWDPLVKLSDARAAIQQAAGAVPEGMRLVPVEPTMAMLDAAGLALYGYPREKAEEWAKLDKFEGQAQKGLDAYRAMLTASPAPPKQQPVHLAACDGGGVQVPLLFSRRKAIADDLGVRMTAEFNAIVRAVELAHGIDWGAPFVAAPTGEGA